MKKRVLLSFLMLVPLSLVAQEMEDYKIYEKVKIDNLFYDLFPDFQWAELTRRGKYSGDIVIPDSVVYNDTIYYVRSIGHGAFRDCRDLVSVTIPNTVESINNEAFEGCKGLTSISIPNSVTTISSSVFINCSNLTSVSIGSGVTIIGSKVFGTVQV